MTRLPARVAALPLALLLALAAALPACKPKEGGDCSGNKASCIDATSGLFCVNGKFATVGCRGAKGCGEDGGQTRCDQGVAGPGDTCLEAGAAACSSDHHAFLTCAGGRFAQKVMCRGPKACAPAGAEIACDQSVAEPDDACSDAGGACTPDHKAFLECKGGKYVKTTACRGPKACSVEGDQVKCDASVGAPGDPCDTGATCTADGKSLLLCESGKLAGRPCRGKAGCHLEGTDVRCDESVAAAGDACTGDGAACSEDGKEMLHCEGDKQTLAKACPKGCTVEGQDIVCK